MDSTASGSAITAEVLTRILDVTCRLAQPFELASMLTEVVDAARAILRADRGSVFLYDAETRQLCTTVATGIDRIQIPVTQGIAGECARTRCVINVPHCYSDPRFNRDVDQRGTYRTECLLAVPLIGYDDTLVGVLELLNKDEGVFTEDDERIACALAAQCAVAIQRVRMTADVVLKAKLERELSLARDVQLRAFPRAMPKVAGYDLAGWSRPAEQVGGDAYDLIALDEYRVTLLLADATGHGIAPALNVTEVRAMLRMAIRLGADLDATFTHINDQLVQDLADNRFVTAFLGVLNTRDHSITYHAGGQGPLLLFHSEGGECEWRDATAVPMGMFGGLPLKRAQVFDLAPGDIVCLISDGILEYPNTDAELFGHARLGEIVGAHRHVPMAELIEVVLRAVETHGAGVPQPDDMTMVMVRRL